MFNIVTSGLLGEGWNPFRWFKIIKSVNDLNISKVTCFPKPFTWKMATSHLRRGVLPIHLRIDNLSSPLHHGRTIRKVGEEKRRPVAKNVVIPVLHPPVPFLWILPNQDANVVLGATVPRDWGDACPHGYVTVDLNETWAQKVVASRCLIRVTLQESTRSSIHPSIHHTQLLNYLPSNKWKVLCCYLRTDRGWPANHLQCC